MPKDVSTEIANLENKLQKLKAKRLEELREKRKEAQKVVADLDAKIAEITGKTAAQMGRRKRTSPEEMRSRIYDELRKHPKDGLSQMQIANDSRLNYVSVAVFLKRNQKEFRTTGERKQKRYFLK
jgi:hypothetical protein